MKSVFSARAWKQTIAPLLPESLKRDMRGRLFGYRPSRRPLSVDFTGGDETAVVVEGLRLQYEPDDLADLRYHLLDNGESIEELASFLERAGSASCFFDVGAAKGLFTHLFCLLGPTRRAVAFEPSPTLLARTGEWAELNGVHRQVTLRQAAVGKTIAQSPARMDPAGFVSVEPPSDSGTSIAVPVTTLDHECQALRVAPDLVKIDVEGYEWDVLCGARWLLQAHKPVLCLELHLDLLERRGVVLETIVSELTAHRYSFLDCLGNPLSATRITSSPNALLRVVCV
jgi:FkbM family methyltransferase